MRFSLHLTGGLAAALLALTPAAAGALVAPPSALPLPAPALVQRAAAVFAATSRGVIAFRSHAVVVTSPHFARPDQIDDVRIVDVDGRAVQVRGGGSGGPAASEAAVHQPYDARYAAEFRYALAPCPGCVAGNVAIAYDTDAHDAAHGRGIIVLDEKTARIVRVIAQPFVVPRPANAGTITTTWGTTPAGWLPVAATGTFTGRIGPFGGHAMLTQQFTAYQRFPDVATAERDAGTP